MKKTTGTDRSITSKWRPQTRAVRAGTRRSEFGETSEALFLTSGYAYDDAETAAARFRGEDPGMTYSRLQNPTVAMLEERIASLEGAEACRVQSSGMAAMSIALLCQLSVGDHIVAGRAAFGSCRWLVDNLLPRSLEFGADVVAYSATKLMDGQGRVLAGAVCGSSAFINDKLLAMQRHTGPNLSPFNAWVVLKGLETLDLRAHRQSENALKVGKFLERRVPRINFPALPSHPQHNLALQQMDACGPIFSFEVADRKQAFALLNALELIDISNNIGDARSLMCHNASTTHYSVSAEVREEMGVSEGMLRLNVGLEDPDDLIDDLDQALAKAGL